MSEDRLKLGIVFNFNPKWMGGIIYVVNLVKTLNHLDERQKPEITLFYNPGLKKFLDEFNYPYFTAIEWEFPSIVSGHVNSWMTGRNVFYDQLINNHKLDVLFPANKFPVKNRTKAKIIAWYADLQHKHYPEFFTRLTLFHREIRLFFMLRNTKDLVLSSESVKNDFIKFYKLRKDIRIHIYHFTSVNYDYPDVDINILREKYKLPTRYFMVSNQFHKHKNHRILLLALAILRKKGILKYLVMTGKLPSAENSPYITELHSIMDENNLHEQICMTGIIPRGDQLAIMRRSEAVLQPSLFEGWSTVIEDAMSLQVPVVASNLDVNIEQLKDKGIYFHPDDPDELASIMQSFSRKTPDADIYGSYTERIKEAAEGIYSFFRS